MSLFKKNSLAVALVGAAVFSVAAIQGCSSDEQSTPAAGGVSGHAGTGGKSSTAGTAGTPANEGGAAGQDGGEAGAAGESAGGAGGEGGAPTIPCSSGLSFDNSTLKAITDNDGELPDLP
ncbi:MAG: hypothetical protein WDO74_31855 [Pseudomonadota bacterium]